MLLRLKLTPKFCHQYSCSQSFLVEEINALPPVCFCLCLQPTQLSLPLPVPTDSFHWITWRKVHQHNHLLRFGPLQWAEKVSSTLFKGNWMSLRCLTGTCLLVVSLPRRFRTKLLISPDTHMAHIGRTAFPFFSAFIFNFSFVLGMSIFFGTF